ncbi:unnamed protein product [Notodromas monacha]|uniref:Uncharacterized protein n=1 Tax=Notodromas monacha TaxID=399045 RepID=A0A7R9BM79_9CRUS|nr:unnamed protein product [Notodromas monacha]CAG0917186.1 unnamed protein product [Notodromas monacha]
MKWSPRIFAQFLLGVSVLTTTAGHGVNEGAFHGDEFRNFLVSGSRTVLNGLRDHFNRGVKFPEERFRQTIAEVNTFISGVEQYVSRETSKPGLNFLPSGYSQETPALEELPDSGKKIIFPTQGQSELQPEELEVRGPQIQTEKSIDEPAGKERCDDSKGFFRHDVDGECRELLSWDACPLGYWLVRKKATLTVTCEPHPCGDTSKIFLGPTGECISSENVTMAAMTVCSETQRPLITEKGAVECFCRDGFFSVPSTTTTTSASPPCFQLHTRGPCKDDEVLVMTTSPAVSPTLGAIATTLSAPLSSSRRRKDNPGSADREPNAEPGVPACRRNLCPQAERLAVSEQHGYCFQLGKQEPCKRGHIFDLHPETHKPTCVQSNEDGLGLPNSAIFQNKEVMCQPASVRSYYKQCVKDEPNSSELRETLYTSCSTHGHWKVLDPISKRVVCREVPCSLTNEFLTTSGACENETRFLSSCKSERNSTSVKLALTTHGTVECECGSGHVFWPLDGNCYQVLASNTCTPTRKRIGHPVYRIAVNRVKNKDNHFRQRTPAPEAFGALGEEYYISRATSESLWVYLTVEIILAS